MAWFATTWFRVTQCGVVRGTELSARPYASRVESFSSTCDHSASRDASSVNLFSTVFIRRMASSTSSVTSCQTTLQRRHTQPTQHTRASARIISCTQRNPNATERQRTHAPANPRARKHRHAHATHTHARARPAPGGSAHFDFVDERLVLRTRLCDLVLRNPKPLTARGCSARPSGATAPMHMRTPVNPTWVLAVLLTLLA